MDNLAEQLAETNLNERKSHNLSNYLRQRELGKINIEKKLRSNLNKIKVLEDRRNKVAERISNAEGIVNSSLEFRSGSMPIYFDYLENQYLNTENIPRDVLSLAEITIPLYNELDRLDDEISKRQEIEKTKIPRITQELIKETE